MTDKNLYNIIKTENDVRELRELSNNMHDGIVISLDFKNHGIIRTGEYSIRYEYDKVDIKLQIMVTSICDKVFELYFKGVDRYRINSNSFDEILEFAVKFDEHGWVTWYDDYPNDNLANFVHAMEMSWRIVSD